VSGDSGIDDEAPRLPDWWYYDGAHKRLWVRSGKKLQCAHDPESTTRVLYIGGLCATIVATLVVSGVLRWWRRGGER